MLELVDSDKGIGPFRPEYREARKNEGRIFMGSKTGKKGCRRVFIVKQISCTYYFRL